jgi:hypothetical protein
MFDLLFISNNTSYTDKRDIRPASYKAGRNAVFYTTTPSAGKSILLTGVLGKFVPMHPCAIKQ